jgi:hypothetical protein
MITAMVFSISKPFKKEITSNMVLCGFLFVGIMFGFYFILVPDPLLGYIFSVRKNIRIYLITILACSHR